MDIREIKQQLTLDQVLDHYGLKPDKNQRLHCPWHDDKTPSLQLTPRPTVGHVLAATVVPAVATRLSSVSKWKATNIKAFWLPNHW